MSDEEEMQVQAVLQLMADVPEVANELRMAIRAHYEELQGLPVYPKTWNRMMRALARFIETDAAVSVAAAKIRESRK